MSIFDKDISVEQYPSWVEAGQVWIYMCDPKGNIQARYYAIVSADQTNYTMETLLSTVTDKAEKAKKKIKVSRPTPYQIQINVENFDNVIHIYAGTCVMTGEEFNKQANKNSVKALLESF